MARVRTPRGNGRTEQVTPQVQLTHDVKKSVVPINLEDQIRVRAYELYEQRGYLPGHDYEDWLTAEQEILARHNQRSA